MKKFINSSEFLVVEFMQEVVSNHEFNMPRGFTAIEEKLKFFEDKYIGFIFKTIVITLIFTMGGVSNPLCESFFFKAFLPVNEKNL